MFWHVSSIATKRTCLTWFLGCFLRACCSSGKTRTTLCLICLIKGHQSCCPPSKIQCFPGYSSWTCQVSFWKRALVVCDVALHTLHTLHIHCIHCTSQPWQELRSAAILSSEASLRWPFFGSRLRSMQPAIVTDDHTWPVFWMVAAKSKPQIWTESNACNLSRLLCDFSWTHLPKNVDQLLRSVAQILEGRGWQHRQAEAFLSKHPVEQWNDKRTVLTFSNSGSLEPLRNLSNSCRIESFASCPLERNLCDHKVVWSF